MLGDMYIIITKNMITFYVFSLQVWELSDDEFDL